MKGILCAALGATCGGMALWCALHVPPYREPAALFLSLGVLAGYLALAHLKGGT